MAQRGALFSEDDIESASSELAGDAHFIGIRRPDEVIHPGDDFETNSKYFLRIKAEQKTKRDAEIKRKRDEAEKARKEEERYKAAIIEAESRARKEEYRRRKIELDALKEVKQRQKDNDAKARREEYLRKKIVDGKAQREIEDQRKSENNENARVDLQERKRIDDQRAEERVSMNEGFDTENDECVMIDDIEGHIFVVNEDSWKEEKNKLDISSQESIDESLEDKQIVYAPKAEKNQDTQTTENHDDERMRVVEVGSIDEFQEQSDEEQSGGNKKVVVGNEERKLQKAWHEEEESENKSSHENEAASRKIIDERKRSEKKNFEERKEKRAPPKNERESVSQRDDPYEACNDEDERSETNLTKLNHSKNQENGSDDERDWDEERGVFIPKKNPIQHRTETSDTCCHHRGFKCCRIISLTILFLIVPLIYLTLIFLEFSTHGWERFAVRTSTAETNNPDSFESSRKSKYLSSIDRSFESVKLIQLREEKTSSPTLNSGWKNQTFSMYVQRNPLTWEIPVVGFFLGLMANIVPMASGLFLFMIFRELLVSQQSQDIMVLCALLQAVNNGILGFISWCIRDVRFFIFRALFIIVPFAWAGYIVGIIRHFTLKDMCRSIFGETRELDLLQTYLCLAFGVFMILISIFVLIGACIGGMNRYCCPSYSGGTTPGCKSFCQWILVLVFAFFTGWMFVANIGAGMGVITFVTLSIVLGVETKRALPTSIVISGWTQMLPVLIHYVTFNEFSFIYLLVIFPGMWVGSIFAPWISRLWGPTIDLVFFFIILITCGSILIVAASTIHLSDLEDINISNKTSILLPFADGLQSSTWSSESSVVPATNLPLVACVDTAAYCYLTTKYCSRSFCPTCHLSHMCDLTCFNCEFSTTSKSDDKKKSVENSNHNSKEERGTPKHHKALSKSDGKPSCPDTEPFCPALFSYCEGSFCPTCLNAHVCDFTCGFKCEAAAPPIASSTPLPYPTVLIQDDSGITTNKQKGQQIPTPVPAFQLGEARTSPEPTPFPDSFEVFDTPTKAPTSKSYEINEHSQTSSVSPPPSVAKLKGELEPTSHQAEKIKEVESYSIMPSIAPIVEKQKPTPTPVPNVIFIIRKTNIPILAPSLQPSTIKLNGKQKPTPSQVPNAIFRTGGETYMPILAPSPQPSTVKLKGKHTPTPAPAVEDKSKIELTRSTNSPISGPTNLPTFVVLDMKNPKPTSVPKLKNTDQPTRAQVAPPNIALADTFDVKVKGLQPSNAPMAFPRTLSPTCVDYVLVNEPTSTPTGTLPGMPISTPSCRPSPTPLSTQTISHVSLKAYSSKVPLDSPTRMPTILQQLSHFPSYLPSVKPIKSSLADSTKLHLTSPSFNPRPSPTIIPIAIPSISPFPVPSSLHSSMLHQPSHFTSHVPSLIPVLATSNSIIIPSSLPTSIPIPQPTVIPRSAPSISPSPIPTRFPIPQPTAIPRSVPSISPLPIPTRLPSPMPHQPSHNPSQIPSLKPISAPSVDPTIFPSYSPSYVPMPDPTISPISDPSIAPFPFPTSIPSPMPHQPSRFPSLNPITSPSAAPTLTPLPFPTYLPSLAPTTFPSHSPLSAPTLQPTAVPSGAPSFPPSLYPTMEPTSAPSSAPSPSATHIPTTTPPPIDPWATFKMYLPVLLGCLSIMIGIAVGLPLGRYIERCSQKLESTRTENVDQKS